MGKKTRRAFKKNLSWKKINTIESRTSIGIGIAVAVKSTTGVTFSHHEPKIKNPELNYVAAERIWVKYCSNHGKTAICTVYCGFQSPDNRHYKWNEGIYSVLTSEVRDLRCQGLGVGDGHR